MQPTGPDPRHPTDNSVSVVIPAMNRGTLIGSALDSIAAQTLQPLEVVVVDDGSTDDTAAIAAARGARVVRLPRNGGSGPARNRGIEESHGAWIAFLDSDDEWLPEHLKNVMGAVADTSHILVAAPGISTDGRVMGHVGQHARLVTSLEAIVPGDLICTSGAVVRKDAIQRAGYFRPLQRAQDLDFFVRILELGSGILTPAPGFRYLMHDQQAIRDNDLMRQCYGEIVSWCLTRPWFSATNADQAWARYRWDAMRAAMTSRQWPDVVSEARWFARRPHTWRTMVLKIGQRRRARSAARR